MPPPDETTPLLQARLNHHLAQQPPPHVRLEVARDLGAEDGQDEGDGLLPKSAEDGEAAGEAEGEQEEEEEEQEQEYKVEEEDERRSTDLEQGLGMDSTSNLVLSDHDHDQTADITPSSPQPPTSLLLPNSSSFSNLRARPLADRSTSPTYGTIHNPNHHFHRRKRAIPKRKLRSKLLFVLVAVLLGVCVYASFVDDFLNEVEAAISCGSCLGLLMPLQALAHVGDDAFVDFFVGFCTNLGIEDADVCLGAVGTQAPILAHDLRSISLASHAAKNFCSTVFGLCPLQQVIPYVVAFESPPPQPENDSTLRPIKKWTSTGRPTFQVVHISDVHVDHEYISGANTICSKVICCRDYGLGSLGPNISLPAGRFGDEHCDSPMDLVDSMFRGINKYAPSRAFSIFTGDVVEAAVWAVDQPSVTDKLHQWYDEMQAPSYPVIGNHDVAPVNAFPRSTSIAARDSQWVFDIAAQDWEKWIGPAAAEQVATRSGCYARVHPGTKLKIISLNTQYWYKQNFWLYDSDEPQWDPNGILSWMASELHSAEKEGQRAWIIGHMPFGKVDAMRDQSNYANQIFQRYHETIAAHFYGHSHNDEFEIAYSDYHNQRLETANGIAFISGALTPASGNPVFRVYDVDPDTYEVMDFTPYYANRSEPSYQVEPEWLPYYSARESYGGMVNPPLAHNESLDGPFWHRVTEKFLEDNNAFQLFNQRMSRGGKVLECRSHHCRNNTICQLRSLRSESNCVVIQPGLSFKDKKRDPDAEDEAEDEDRMHWEGEGVTPACEGPGLGSMLRRLALTSRHQNLEDNSLYKFYMAASAFSNSTADRRQVQAVFGV